MTGVRGRRPVCCISFDDSPRRFAVVGSPLRSVGSGGGGGRFGRPRHHGVRLRVVQGGQQHVHRAPGQVLVLVPLPTEVFGPVRSLARRTHRRLGTERLLDGVRLPLYHAQRQWLVDEVAVGIRARTVHGDAHVRRRPRRCRVRVPHPAHVARFEVLLALVAHGQAGIGVLHAQRLLEAGRREGQYVLVE